MTFKRPKARINERTITAGNGPYALAGAVDGSYNTFASFMSIGDTTHLSVVEPGVAFWTGTATYSASNQITLTTVEETAGTFGAGTKEIFAGTLAARSAFFDDISGAIVTGGTSTAYTVASYRVYDTLARMDGALIAFTPHTANGASPTLNVDGLGAKPLRLSTAVDIQTNVLIAGTPYMATYNNSDAAWYLHGLGSNAYGTPLGGGMDYWAATAPSSAWVFPVGQAISRATYASLFTLVGTTYGSGNGTTTFNLPDKSGRVSVGLDSAGRLANVFSGNGLGATGGADTQTLDRSQIPTGIVSAQNSISVSVTTSNIIPNSSVWSPTGTHQGGASGGNMAGTSGGVIQYQAQGSSGTISVSATSNNTSGLSHPNVQPTICCNYIMRII